LKKLVDDTQRDVNGTLLNPSRDRLDLFLKLLGLATRSIKIMTYVIDDHMADRLIEIKGNRNLSVKVIIDRRKLNESETVKSKLVGNGIEVKSLDNLHAKVYIIDDALVLEGSMNLTVKGLVENTENIELKTNPLDVYQFVENFDEAWKNAS
jgi:phosphatidylserine/phosphatidylglycerophosphate/cardiolipin synthase-like enzyme